MTTQRRIPGQAKELLANGKFSRAIDLLENDETFASGDEEARLLLLRACHSVGRVTRSEEICRGLLSRDSCRTAALDFLCRALASQGRIREAGEVSDQILQESDYRADFHSRAIMWAHCDDTLSAEALLHRSQEYERRQGPARIPEDFPNSPDESRRLRIGLISVEMMDHSKYFFTRPLLAALDRSQFQIFVYADTRNPDAFTERLREAADCWHDLHGLSDSEVVQRIRDDEIDILIDLMGHVPRSRLRCLLDKPAPILVEYGETPSGLSIFDYRISDAVADPPGREPPGATPLIRIQNGFHVYEPPEDAPPVRPPTPPYDQQPVFCCLANSVKYSPSLLSAWAAILQRVPNAWLLLKADSFRDPAFAANLRGHFAGHGIAPERIRCFATLPERQWHLRMYNLADVALDTFPFNGVTTTCEALWMGTPVVTTTGDHHMARRGASLVDSAGFHELIADSWDAYIQTAVELVQDERRLAEYRETMRDRMRQSPLCDARRLATSLAEAFRSMWQDWCRCGKNGVAMAR